MNFSSLQWASGFILDVLIKSALVAYIGLLVTLSGAPVADLVELAIPLSLFHFFCLFLASLLLLALARLGLELANSVKFLVTLIAANALFVMVFAASTSWRRIDEISSILDSGLMLGAVLAITNILPIVIVAACGRIFNRR